MNSLKQKIYTIIFEHDTRYGKLFDVWLIIFVLLSVIVVMLESISVYKANYYNLFEIVEWFFTIAFSIELLLRLYCVEKKLNYVFSFFGVVDIVSILPTYLSIFIPGAQSFIVFRALRMLRIFRILKLQKYTLAGSNLQSALSASRPKITVFLGFVLTIVLIVGALMYLIESRDSGFTSIPKSVYWAIVTMTTVGYGDITPQTPLGQLLSSFLMIVGYGVLAVPTGIVSVEMAKVDMALECRSCGSIINKNTAKFCEHCGIKVAHQKKKNHLEL